jgi:hypothetical protein
MIVEGRHAMIKLACTFVGLLLFMVASGAVAQQHERLLRTSLESVAQGAPDYDTMEPLLANGVEQTLSATRQRLSALGKIRKLTYKGIQTTPMGQAEAYSVEFERGMMFL